MEEIWQCLPTFRKLISFTGGWDEVRMNAWQLLNAAVTCLYLCPFCLLSLIQLGLKIAPEIIQFPMHLLVAAALAEGILDTLAAAYEEEADDYESEQNAAEDARIASSGVIRDIRDLMNISSVSFTSSAMTFE